MLTSDLIKPRLRMQGSCVSVEMVDENDPSLLQTARELINLFQQHIGQSQECWENVLEAYEGTRTDYILIRGIAKVLLDNAEFTPTASPFPPTILREKVFSYGPVFQHPDILNAVTRQDVLQEVSHELDLVPDQLDALLFADRHASYQLTTSGPSWTPASLLARYNLELARGVLYWASYITIEVADNYKDLWKFIKLFKLMFNAETLQDGGYRIELDGPISPFVTSTLRYGRQLAAFLPALLLCEQWQMSAHVYPPQGRGEMLYSLNSTSSLQSHFKRSGPFDSRLEADFAHDFEQKMGSKRGSWHLLRESEVLLLGDTVMIPDFVLLDEQEEQRKILIELVGFWHPQYLRRKLEKVRAAKCANLLLLVYEGLNITEEAFQDVPGEVLFFRNKPVLKTVLDTVDTMAERIYGPRPTYGTREKTRRTPKRQPTTDNTD